MKVQPKMSDMKGIENLKKMNTIEQIAKERLARKRTSVLTS